VLFNCGLGDSVWELPGGRLHDGEEPEAGLVREVKEELNLDTTIGRPVHICRSYHVKNDVWQPTAAYECSVSSDQTITVSEDEVEEYRWLAINELSSLPVFEDCRLLVDSWLAIR